MKNSNKMFSFIEKPKQEQKISKSLVSFLLTEEQEKQITGGVAGDVGGGDVGIWDCTGWAIEYCMVKSASCDEFYVPGGHCSDYTYCVRPY